MRVYANYEQLQLWRAHPELRERLTPEHVSAIRFQPVIRQSLPKSIIDLIFRSNAGYLAVPAILVDSPQIVAEEKDPLIWPAAVAHALEDERCEAFAELVIPWIRSLAMGRGLNEERIRHLGSQADRTAFEEARAAHLAGTAPIEDVARALGPYVYASRYAVGKRIAVRNAPDGAQGAAYLSHLGTVSAEFPAREAELAARWFSPFGSLADEEGAELLITGPDDDSDGAVVIRLDDRSASATRRVVAQAYPMDIVFSNHTLHGPPVRTFSVAATPREFSKRPAAVAPYVATGGSAGRVLIGLREDWESSPDADVDGALELARLLRAEGLTVDLCGQPAACDFASYDIVHCFNLIEIGSVLQFFTRARQAGVRTVLTATFEDVADERTWGAATAPTAIREAIDEPSVERYIDFLERRALLAPGWEERSRRGPFPEYDKLVEQALSLADAVIVESAAEGALLGERYGRPDARIVPPLVPQPAAGAIAPPLTLERFALVHAPFEPRANQIFAVRAARQAGIDLVLAGAARDMEYAARIREAAGVRVFMVEQPAPADIDWLYENASIYLDCSWFGYGTARLQRAMLRGIPVVCSRTGWGPSLWPGGVSAVDPASPKSISAGLVSAKAPPPSQLDPKQVLRNVLGAYLGSPAVPSPA